MKAAVVGNEKIASELLEYRVDVNTTNDDGNSALHLAATNSKNQ